MKKILLLMLVLLTGTLMASAQAPNGKSPKFQFVGGDMKDFGTVTEQSRTTRVYTFKNVGKSPLIISQAQGSCGCTTATFDPKPVPPGKTGEIKVTYAATAGTGAFEKTVFVHSNAGPVYELRFKVAVKK